MAYVPLTDQDSEMEMHHPRSWVGKYVWSQDHKVIAIQYGSIAVFTGVVGMVLSMLFRLQLGFPESVDFVDPSFYYQSVTMHGMIMVIYLLTALFLGGFGNYLIPLMVGARDMVFPFMNMLSVWVFLLSVLILMASFFVSRWSDWCRMDALPTTSRDGRYAGKRYGDCTDGGLPGRVCRRLHHGWPELRSHCAAVSLPRYDHDAPAAKCLGHLSLQL